MYKKERKLYLMNITCEQAKLIAEERKNRMLIKAQKCIESSKTIYKIEKMIEESARRGDSGVEAEIKLPKECWQQILDIVEETFSSRGFRFLRRPFAEPTLFGKVKTTFTIRWCY